MTEFKSLFEPVHIGTMTAPNRILMPSMSINFGVDDRGFVNDQLTEYFAARARGGAGMMLLGGAAVHPTGIEAPQLPAMWEEDCVPALKRMTDRIRAYDVRFGVQLMHGGRQAYHDNKVGPSAIPAPALVKGTPKELTADEIQELVAAFGDSARRCRDGGFDFVEIHAAHGYLINQFFSPNANQRTDEYGGSFENRIRFMLELFRDMKKKAGKDFPIGVRINGDDYIRDGWTLEDTLRLAPILEAEGADYLHVSAGVYGSTQLTIPSMYVEHGCFVHLAEAVKQVVSIPVAAVGRIKKPEMAEAVIRDGKADIVAIGRSLIADPDWPEKARTGKTDEIRPCMGCCLGCIQAVFNQEPGGCVVNPDVGREYLIKDEAPVPDPRKVLVVGAGPAGMGAARILAKRGHSVTVCEQKAEAGGLLRLAAMPPGRGEIGDFLAFQERELERLAVEVLRDTELSEALVDRLNPDAVVLATGSLPEMPIVKGLFQTEMELATVVDVMEGEIEAGKKILILGGGQAGLVLADFLAEQGRDIAVLNRRAHFAEEMSSNDRFYLRERLKRDNVRLFKKVSVEAFLKTGVRFKSDGVFNCLEDCDTVIISEKMTSVRDAVGMLKKKGVEYHIVGDAKTPRNLMLCLSEAEELARSL